MNNLLRAAFAMAMLSGITTMLIPFGATAQNPLSEHTQVEVGLGFATPLLQGGTELNRSRELRISGRSYFQDTNGNRRQVGKYPHPTGWALSVAFYKPVSWAKGLMLGTAVRTSLTGTQPGEGGYEEGFYFNYVSVGPALKYYPLTKANLFVKAEGGMGAVFTKNRYLNAEGQQNFFHQFGIGNSVGAGLGYSLTPFANKRQSIDIQAVYQQFSTRVEVNGLGDDQWRFGSLNVGIACTY